MVAQIALKYNITPTELAEFAEFMRKALIPGMRSELKGSHG